MTLSNTKLEMIRRLIRRQLIGPLGKILDTLKAADLSEIMVKLTPEEQRIVLTTLHLSGKAGELLAELPEKNLREILGGVNDALLHKILTQVQADDAAMLLEHVDRVRAFEVLERLPSMISEKIEEIMRYPHDTAGSMMNTGFLEFYEATTAREALESLREYTRDTNDPIYSLYVMDETHKLMGVISIRALALAQPEDPLEEIMDRDPVVVDAFASTEEAARLITKYDLVSLPVVDESFALVGIIMVDDMIDTIMESMADEAYLMQGVTEQDRLETPVLRSVRSRLPWMAVNLLTAFVASSVVGLFEKSIAQVVALATFMPIVAGLGGNTGTQSLAVTIRALALGELERAEALRAVFRQVMVAILIGSIIGVSTGLIAYGWRGSPVLGLVIASSMLINMTIAGLVGSGVPLLLKAVGQDPAMGGGVLVTAVTDSLGFLAFLGIATMFIGYL